MSYPFQGVSNKISCLECKPTNFFSILYRGRTITLIHPAWVIQQPHPLMQTILIRLIQTQHPATHRTKIPARIRLIRVDIQHTRRKAPIRLKALTPLNRLIHPHNLHILQHSQCIRIWGARGAIPVGRIRMWAARGAIPVGRIRHTITGLLSLFKSR